MDGTILVVSSGYVNKKEVMRAVSLLRNVKGSILGVVLNALDIKKMFGSYYYYFHYYQYYYYYGSDPKKKGERRTKRPMESDYQEVT